MKDVFVYPHIIEAEPAAGNKVKTLQKNISAEILLELNHRLTLIFGEELSGKTSLLKMLMVRFEKKNYIPLLLNGESISTVKSKQKLKDALGQQYELSTQTKYETMTGKRICLLDDFHLCKLNYEYKNRFVKELLNQFDFVILFSDSLLKFDDKIHAMFVGFKKYEILDLGYVKRDELIRNWCKLGVEEIISEKNLVDEVSTLTNHVNSIVRKNIVPSKPIFILSILQSLEISQANNHAISSYGYCYNFLISNIFERMKLKRGLIDSLINFITHLSFHIYKSGNRSISVEDYYVFKDGYEEKYLIPKNELDILLRSKILMDNGENVYFSHKYVFYFYVAKYIVSEDMSDKGLSDILQELCENLHTDKASNILIFLVHHTKKQSVIDEILLYVECIFDSVCEAKLCANETEFMKDILNHIPDLVIEQIDIDKERGVRLEVKDAINNIVDDQVEEEYERIGYSDIDENKFLSEINKAMKAVELIGQILKSRHGSLKINQLKDLAESAYSVGLRFLSFYLKAVDVFENEIKSFIKGIILNDADVDKDKISQKAKEFYLYLCYGLTKSLLTKISFSTGHSEIVSILDEISDESSDSAAIRLINLMTKLEFTHQLPKKYIKSLKMEFSKNCIATRILNEMVVQYLYLYYVDYKDIDWINKVLGIPIKPQIMIQFDRQTKLLQKNP
ncbi:hypothetical protein [Zooshikella sp. RANM57]|uniref:hypothetical protein n=1 Tax=Zooshikella sp. RANM57 TaxID=3425863 RepID=UPI003D6F732B